MFIKLHYPDFRTLPTCVSRGDPFFVNPRYITNVDRAYMHNPHVGIDTAMISVEGREYSPHQIVFESIGEVMELIAQAEKRHA